MIVYYDCTTSDKLDGTIPALPLTLFIGFYGFRRASLYINRKKGAVMLGDFRRFSPGNVGFELRLSQGASLYLFADTLLEPVIVWVSSNEAEAQKSYDILTQEVDYCVRHRLDGAHALF